MNKFISICLASVLGVTTLVGGTTAVLNHETAVQIGDTRPTIQEETNDAKFVSKNTIEKEITTNQDNKTNANINAVANDCVNGNCETNANVYNSVYGNMNNSNAGYNNAYNAGYNNYNYGT